MIWYVCVCVSVCVFYCLFNVVYHWGYPLGAVEMNGGPALQELCSKFSFGGKPFQKKISPPRGSFERRQNPLSRGRSMVNQLIG